MVFTLLGLAYCLHLVGLMLLQSVDEPAWARRLRGAGVRMPYSLGAKPWSFALTPRDQLRLRLTDHDFERLMQAAKPLPVSDRDAFLRDVAAELGQHEVVGPGLLHRVISEVQRRYIAPRERATG